MARKPSFNMEEQKDFLNALFEHYGQPVLSSKQILDFAERNGYSVPYFLLRDESRKIGRGKFQIRDRNVPSHSPAVAHAVSQAVERFEEAPAMTAQVITLQPRRAANITESFIPDKNGTYVPFGFYSDLKNIIQSKIFYPIYITGLSGNGKTLMVEQVCAALKRELIRVNITKRTDETDLIGSYELIDGNTVRREGPAIIAMKRGAILLLDETDYGSEDLLCLQPILEGKPYFDKKTGEIVHPAVGFNVIATANTKGKGSDDGRFIGANVLNEAFLERFAVTVEQEYPNSATERKILKKNFDELGVEDDVFIDRLITWAEVIRKTFMDGAVDEVVSTRRLVHISKAFSIFKDRMKAIELCLNRFDTETKTAFLDLYTKVDADVNKDDSKNIASDANSTITPPEDSSIEWKLVAADISRRQGTDVKIVNNSNGGIDVYSHGNKHTIDPATINSYGSDVQRIFTEAVLINKNKEVSNIPF